MNPNPSPKIEREGAFWHCTFEAMASPCELLFEATAGQYEDILALATLASEEALRIEHKFSRYRDDNIVYAINHANGAVVQVDEETARMLDYAEQLHSMSEGMFDITSGVLRRLWRFDGSDKLPEPQAVDAVLPLIGWQKVQWKNPEIILPPKMEIDFGGIGKEYAVDRTVRILQAHTKTNFIVNYGGDLYVTGPHTDGSGWRVGLDDPGHTGERARATIELNHGGVATSGDARRFLLRDGIRYSHILDPHTGWPVKNAPRAVTVVASTCIEAGMLATFAMLQGENAEPFLLQQGVKFWCC